MTAGRPQGKRPLRWFTLVFGAALLYLGYRTYFFTDPRLTPELASALATAGRLFFALGGLSVAVVVAGAVWRSPKARLVDLVEALAYGAGGLFLLSLRSQGKGGGLFESPMLPMALLVIGLIKTFVAYRELRRSLASTPAPPKK